VTWLEREDLAQRFRRGRRIVDFRQPRRSQLAEYRLAAFRANEHRNRTDAFLEYDACLLTVKRDLALAVDPALYPLIEGTTDSEVLFYLAVTLGLEDDPPGAVERAIGLVEDVGRRHEVKHPFQGTIATTDGERLWAFRYSSEGKSRSLYFSTAYETLKMLYPDDARLDDFDEETRVVVSEPLGDLVGVWNPVPEASWGVVQPGQDELSTFRPAAPVVA